MPEPSHQPGVVVIGRNEGERLRRCLASVLAPVGAPPRTIVYVDSGSTDGSVELARGLGIEVVALEMSSPFSASRGRNTGLRRLLELAPETELVQFVDGDCEVNPGWLAAGVAALEAEPMTAAVCGRLRERFPDASIYNRLCDIEWDAPPGLARSCGGNAMYRVAPLLAVGAFNEAVVAGEEPELCYRLRQAGHTIRRLPDEMALHDADMHRFAQWWKRAARGGWAMAHGAALHGHGPERFNLRRIRSVLFWTLVLPGFLLGWCIAIWTWALIWVIALSAKASLWLVLLMHAPLALILLYPWLYTRLLRMHRARGRSFRDADRAANFTILAKFAELTGIVKFWLARRTRRVPVTPAFDKRPASAPA